MTDTLTTYEAYTSYHTRPLDPDLYVDLDGEVFICKKFEYEQSPERTLLVLRGVRRRVSDAPTIIEILDAVNFLLIGLNKYTKMNLLLELIADLKLMAEKQKKSLKTEK